MASILPQCALNRSCFDFRDGRPGGLGGRPARFLGQLGPQLGQLQELLARPWPARFGRLPLEAARLARYWMDSLMIAGPGV